MSTEGTPSFETQSTEDRVVELNLGTVRHIISRTGLDFSRLYLAEGTTAVRCLDRDCDPVNRRALDRMYKTIGARVSDQWVVVTDSSNNEYARRTGYCRRDLITPLQEGLIIQETFASQGSWRSFSVSVMREDLDRELDELAA